MIENEENPANPREPIPDDTVDRPPQEQPAQQPTYPQVAVELAPDGLHVLVAPAPVTVGIAPDVMDALCKQWIARRPALLSAILQEYIDKMRKAQSGLRVVRDPKAIQEVAKSKNRLQA